MIFVDGNEFKYVTFPDKTCDYMKDKMRRVDHIKWIYDGRLEEVFICLSLLKNQFVKSFEFVFLPFARQDKQFEGFGGLYSFLDLFHQFHHTTFLVNDAHNPISLPKGWINIYDPFLVPNDGKSMVVFPDKNALFKYGCHYEHIPYMYANKVRIQHSGEIGQIVLFEPIPDNIESIYVIDDICDGGKTFIELLPLLPEHTVKHLMTTYGIYSKGKQVLYDAGYTSVKCQYNIFNKE